MKTVFWLCIFFASNVYAQASYLECEVSGNKTVIGVSSSEVAKLTPQKIAVTLIQSKEVLIIAGEGSPDYIFSGSSKALKDQQEFKATNMSTESVYSLNVSFKKNNGVSQSTDISINRVTGAILVTKQTLIGSYLNSVDLAGFCKKMSSANKF